MLTEKGTEALLDDPLLSESRCVFYRHLDNATVEIMPEGRSRVGVVISNLWITFQFEIQKQIRSKEKAVATLAKKYQNSELSKDDV